MNRMDGKQPSGQYKITIPASAYDNHIASEKDTHTRRAYLNGTRKHWLGGVTWFGGLDDYRVLMHGLFLYPGGTHETK